MISDARPPWIVAVAAHKGGAHKTTLAVHLAAYYARTRPTLLVDTDPQGDATHLLTGRWPASGHLATVLAEGRADPGAVCDVRPGLRLLGASAALETVALQSAALEQLGRCLATLPDVATIVLDTPPGMSLLLLSALTAAQVVLMPIRPALFSLAGTQSMLQTVSELSRRDRQPRASWLVLSGLDRRLRAAAEVTAEARRRFSSQVLRTEIPRQATVENSTLAGELLYDYAPRARVTKALAAMAQELITVSAGGDLA